jgi:hypothetical protein
MGRKLKGSESTVVASGRVTISDLELILREHGDIRSALEYLANEIRSESVTEPVHENTKTPTITFPFFKPLFGEEVEFGMMPPEDEESVSVC